MCRTTDDTGITLESVPENTRPLGFCGTAVLYSRVDVTAVAGLCCKMSKNLSKNFGSLRCSQSMCLLMPTFGSQVQAQQMAELAGFHCLNQANRSMGTRADSVCFACRANPTLDHVRTSHGQPCRYGGMVCRETTATNATPYAQKITSVLSVVSPVGLNTRKSCDLCLGQHTWGLLGSIVGFAPRYRPCRICRAASASSPCRYLHHNLDKYRRQHKTHNEMTKHPKRHVALPRAVGALYSTHTCFTGVQQYVCNGQNTAVAWTITYTYSRATRA